MNEYGNNSTFPSAMPTTFVCGETPVSDGLPDNTVTSASDKLTGILPKSKASEVATGNKFAILTIYVSVSLLNTTDAP